VRSHVVSQEAALAELPLLKGTLDLLVLKTLSWGAMHGYAIASWLEQRSAGTLAVEDSALYQALHRLEDRGLVEAEWGLTETNRRARYYSLTSAGRQRLRTETTTWLRYTESVTSILALTSRIV
jgi:PadR family transcriptional regulator PadR